ncbi:MAG: heparin lyase I family protein [Microvirga sp.]
MRRRVAGLISAACLSIASPSSAQVIRDDFSSGGLSPRNWFVCRRPENEFKLVQSEDAAFRAVEATVRPRKDMVFAMLVAHPACANSGVPFEPERDERAELWEADDIRLEFGTDVWYRFSFMVDPALPTDAGRLVIGQWKQANSATGSSPVIAQRFNGRAFTITVEQDNTAPDRAPDDPQCRIWVAVDRNAALEAGRSESHGLALLGRPLHEPQSPAPPGDLPSAGHDDFEVSHRQTLRPDGARVPAACKQDVEVTRLGVLPDVFGRWVTMLYHIHLDGPSSLLEIWADGQPIAKVRGRIGFRTNGPGKQYFKFGPYRDHQAYATFARMTRYARGFRHEDVEP